MTPPSEIEEQQAADALARHYIAEAQKAAEAAEAARQQAAQLQGR